MLKKIKYIDRNKGKEIEQVNILRNLGLLNVYMSSHSSLCLRCPHCGVLTRNRVEVEQGPTGGGFLKPIIYICPVGGMQG